jgi:hypothetical protein
MKKHIYMVGCCIVVVATLRPALAASPKAKPVHPSPVSGPIPAATTSSSRHLPPGALQREIQELERAEHLIEMSAHNDRNGHEASAARHLRAAINELKLESMKDAEAKRGGGQPTQAASAATPSIRKK